MKTMNKKTGRRRKRFPLKCVKDGIVVTKCSWKMNLVSDCVVNSWFCALARPRLWERGQYRQWQGEVKEKTLLKPNVFRSTPAKIRGTIVFGTREHQGGIESDRQSSYCVSDRNRDCQRSLRASWRKQQVCKCLNLCEKPLPRNRHWCQVCSRAVDAHLACAGDCWQTL